MDNETLQRLHNAVNRYVDLLYTLGHQNKDTGKLIAAFEWGRMD